MTFKKFITFEIPGEESRDLDVAALSIEPSDSTETYDLRSSAAPIPQTFSFESIRAEVGDKNLDLDSIVLRAVGFPRNARDRESTWLKVESCRSRWKSSFDTAGPQPSPIAILECLFRRRRRIWTA